MRTEPHGVIFSDRVTDTVYTKGSLSQVLVKSET